MFLLFFCIFLTFDIPFTQSLHHPAQISINMFLPLYKSNISEKVISTSSLVNSTSFNALLLNELSCAFTEHKEKNKMIKNKILFMELFYVLYFNT